MNKLPPTAGANAMSRGVHLCSMVHAFIMVKTGAGESERLLAPIRELETVTEAHIVAGAYDVIAEVDTDEVYEVLQTASSKVQGLQGVTDTKTYIAMDD